MAYWLWQAPPLSNICFSLATAQPEFDELFEARALWKGNFVNLEVSEFLKNKGEIKCTTNLSQNQALQQYLH
jgi:hypothetical protein